MVIVAGGIGIGVQITDNTPSPTTVSEIMAAPDMHSTTLDVPGGGTATTAFSPSEDAAVLTMNGVTPRARTRFIRCGWSRRTVAP